MWLSRRRNEVIAGLTITAAVLAAAVAAPWLTVVGGFAVGVFAVLTHLLLRGAVAGMRARRAVPTVITPDPWLEQPKPLPVEPVVPPPTEPPPAGAAAPTDDQPKDPRP